MKRKGILMLALILMVSALAAASAAPEQIASAYVKADLEGKVLCKVVVDLADQWSVRFDPSTVYLYRRAFDTTTPFTTDYEGYISLCSREEYDSTLENWTKEGMEYEEKDGYVVAPYWEDMTLYVKPVDEEVYLEVFIYNTVNAEDVLSHILSCERYM